MAKWWERARRKWDNALGDSFVGQTIAGVTNPFDTQNYLDPTGIAHDKILGEEAAEAAEAAANKQEQAAKDAAGVQKEIYYQSREDMLPWLNVGKQGLGALHHGLLSGQFDMPQEEFKSGGYQIPGEFQSEYQLPGEFKSQYGMPDEFSYNMDDFQQDPYYQFLQDEGMKQIQRSAAGRSGLLSGNTMAGLQQRGMGLAAGAYGDQFNRKLSGYQTNLDRARTGFGQDLAGHQANMDRARTGYGQDLTSYQQNLSRALGERDFGYGNFLDSYNRRMSEKTSKYNRLANIAGLGQTQSGALGSLGQGFGSSYGNMMQNIANAQAGGIMGAAQARQQGTQNAAGLGLAALAYFSDKRLKRNYNKIGKWNGFDKYIFQYLWSPVWHIGVMAQDVIKKRPDAIEWENGFMKVNYGVL